MTEHLKKCGDRTKERISWLLAVEKRPYTLNTHYYSDYKEKFLSFYRGARETGTNGELVRNLQSHNPLVKDAATPFQAGMAQILSGLPQVGIAGTQAVDLAKLLAVDPLEPALAIMAGVRGYFQGIL